MRVICLLTVLLVGVSGPACVDRDWDCKELRATMDRTCRTQEDMLRVALEQYEQGRTRTVGFGDLEQDETALEAGRLFDICNSVHRSTLERRAEVSRTFSIALDVLVGQRSDHAAIRRALQSMLEAYAAVNALPMR